MTSSMSGIDQPHRLGQAALVAPMGREVGDRGEGAGIEHAHAARLVVGDGDQAAVVARLQMRPQIVFALVIGGEFDAERRRFATMHHFGHP